MNITPIDIEEIRSAFRWIAHRVERGHEGVQPIAGSTAMKASAYLDHLETSAASCTCGAHERGSSFTPRNDRPFHTELALKQAARVREADQASGFDTVLATVAAHKAAGLREVVS